MKSKGSFKTILTDYSSWVKLSKNGEPKFINSVFDFDFLDFVFFNFFAYYSSSCPSYPSYIKVSSSYSYSSDNYSVSL